MLSEPAELHWTILDIAPTCVCWSHPNLGLDIMHDTSVRVRARPTPSAHAYSGVFAFELSGRIALEDNLSDVLIHVAHAVATCSIGLPF